MPCEGLVVAAGPGRTHPLTGTLIPMCVSEGDTVLFSRWSGRKVSARYGTVMVFVVVRYRTVLVFVVVWSCAGCSDGTVLLFLVVRYGT